MAVARRRARARRMPMNKQMQRKPRLGAKKKIKLNSTRKTDRNNRVLRLPRIIITSNSTRKASRIMSRRDTLLIIIPVADQTSSMQEMSSM